MRTAQKYAVVGLGEILWDQFAGERRPGGAPANVAAHAAQLGARGVVCSRVGRDELGEALCSHLQSRGLSIDHVQYDDDHPTGTVTVDASQPDDPTYIIHADAAWDYLAYTTDLATLMPTADAVCFGTLAQRSPQSAETIQHAIAAAERALIVLDVNLRQDWFTRATLERSLHASDMVKLNAHEQRVLAGLLQIPAPQPAAFAECLAERFSLEWVCITRGNQGCLLWADGQVADEPGIAVPVVDAVGAGDAFCAALTIAQLRGWPPADAAHFANKVGALVASCAGAAPDLLEPYAALIRRFAQGADA